MAALIFSLLLFFSICPPSCSLPSPAPRGFPLSCGSSEEVTQGSLAYIPDEGFISVGNKSKLNAPDLLPVLSTLRYFADESSRKYCYVFPVTKGGKYMARTSFFYGNFDGKGKPAVFDQIIQGTKWSVVNTTEDYANGMYTYYEFILVSMAKTLSVCLARNKDTTSSPFISAIEVQFLEDSMYNSTDFTQYGLVTIARQSFGHGDILFGFPDDQFNRLWHPLVDENPVVESHSNITSSEFWNFPPPRGFATAITTSRGQELKIRWPSMILPDNNYYIALYFQDNRTPSPYCWRVFTVSINGREVCKDLNVTADGVAVYASEWPLSGKTEITLSPAEGMPVGPVINAGEILQLLPLGGTTLTRDVMAMEDLARGFDNPPSDWSGDPCSPSENSWTGVTCSSDKLSRVVSLNLTAMAISGLIPSSIGNLTALTHLWLGKNKLSGTIPDLSNAKALETLHLEDNQLEGSIPEYLGQLEKLHEMYLFMDLFQNFHETS